MPSFKVKETLGDKVPIFEVIKNSVKIFNLNKNEFICLFSNKECLNYKESLIKIQK